MTMSSWRFKERVCLNKTVNPRAEAIADLVQLAMTPGWWHYSKSRALELEEESATHGHGLYRGIRQEIRLELKRQKFRPSPQELQEPWNDPRR